MKSIIAALLLIFVCSSSFCQQSYLPGFIISSNGDSMQVTLQEEIRSELLLQVKYKKDNASSNISIARAGDIKGFGYIGGSVYKSISLADDPADSINVKNYFAEQLLAGACDLFVFSKKDRQVYIVNKENH